MEIAKVYRWFEKRSEEMSKITGNYYGGQSIRKPKIQTNRSQQNSRIGLSQRERYALVMETERGLLEEKNKFLRIFPKENANYTKEEEEENDRVIGYFEYLDKGQNNMTREFETTEPTGEKSDVKILKDTYVKK